LYYPFFKIYRFVKRSLNQLWMIVATRSFRTNGNIKRL
jgi:hypothetical protein